MPPKGKGFAIGYLDTLPYGNKTSKKSTDF